MNQYVVRGKKMPVRIRYGEWAWESAFSEQGEAVGTIDRSRKEIKRAEAIFA